MSQYLKSNCTNLNIYRDFLVKFLAIIIFTMLVFISQLAIAKQQNIFIVVPIEHESLKKIVEGIEQNFSSDKYKIIVKNAQGDLNLMYSIVNQINNQDFDLVIPIGTQTSQLTLNIIKNRPIIAAAAIIDNKNLPLVTGINDEVPITSSLSNLPILKNLAVIYSASEKIMPEIEELRNYAKKNNIILHLKMVSTLLELSSAVKTISNDVQSFLILKDHLVVSGINILIQEAAKRKIPIIASDEGSVLSGATIAIGVKEQEIGLIVGKLAKDILNGTSPAAIPYQTIDKLTLFINEKSFKTQNILKLEDLASLNLPQQKIAD